MPNLQHAGEEFLPQTRREWVVQRIAWMIMALILVGALAGAFGNGPLSKRTLRTQDGSLTVEYQRVVRFQAQTELRMILIPPESSREPVAVKFGGGYFHHFEIESISPEPLAQYAGDGSLMLEFRPLAQGQPVEISVHAKVSALGSLTGTLERMGGGPFEQLHLKQFALP